MPVQGDRGHGNEHRDFKIAGKQPQTSAELAGLILEEAEVAVVPGEAFGTPGYFRLSCALGDADLEEGVGRMAKLLADAR